MIHLSRYLVVSSLLLCLACENSEGPEGESARSGGTGGGAASATGGAPSVAGGSGAAASATGGAPAGEGLCSVVNVEAVAALMEEPLEVQSNTNLLCKLVGSGSHSFVLQRVLTGGAERYDQKKSLLGSDEELSGVGDRAFRSGFPMYGVQLGEQYVEMTFATTKNLDAGGRLTLVKDLVEALQS